MQKGRVEVKHGVNIVQNGFARIYTTQISDLSKTVQSTSLRVSSKAELEEYFVISLIK